MRTALAASVAAAAKWTFVAAPLGLQAVPKRQSVWSRAAGADAKRNGRVPDYENRTCSQRCSRCQMDFFGGSGVGGCFGTAVFVVKGS
ncbi:MAG: hypothetical protein PUG07_08400 [Ruminococcus sp.]|nr:hypothetical protein [Ruminococcus sp.]